MEGMPVFCPNCGEKIEDDKLTCCPKCGESLSQEENKKIAVSAPIVSTDNPVPTTAKKSLDPSIVSFIYSGVGIVLSIIAFFIFGFLSFCALALGILGIVTSAKELKKADTNKSLAICSLVLAIITTILASVCSILYIITSIASASSIL